MILLARFVSLPEAAVAKSLLEANGIHALMPETGMVAGQFDMGVMGGWRLLVPEEEVLAAQRVLRDAKMLPADE